MQSNESFILLDKTYLPQMAKLIKSAFMGEPWNDDWSDKGQLYAYISDIACCPNSLNYGLIKDGRLIALSTGSLRHWWEGTNYSIEEFCIAPDMQCSGIGSRFLSMVEEDAKKRGAAGIFLQTDNDKPSYRFYLKNGFGELKAHVSFFKKI